MAEVVGRTITFVKDNAETYLTADGVTLATTYLGYDLTFRSLSRSGYATLNDAAKTVLFPNTAAHPIKADSTVTIGASVNNNNNYLELQFAGTAVQKTLCADTNGVSTGMTDSVITSATKASEIRYHLNINSLFVAGMMQTATITLYFNQYDFSAQAVGNGVTSAAVGNSSPFEEDSVTFTAVLASGATWHGWYFDAACTQLASAEQTYTATAKADTVLYAYATKDVTGTGLYLRQDGAYTQAQSAYQKVGGAWVLQTSDEYKTLLQSGNWCKPE